MSVLSCVLGTLWSAAASAESPQDIDRLTERWLDTERQITLVQSDWREQEPLLEQRVDLLEAEKRQLQTVLKESSANSDDVEAKRAELLAQQAELEAQQSTLQQSLKGLLAKLETLRAFLPETVKSLWEAEAGILTEDADASVKLQVALAQLEKLSEFNDRVSVNEKAVKAPDGTDMMVKELYLGVSTAWFVSADGRYAGTGKATADGWQWQYQEDIDATEITRAVAVFEKQAQADFVRLPVALQGEQP